MADPVPALTPDRLLPEGTHTLTLDQVGQLFGRFQRSDRRPRLFAKLSEYVRELRLAGWAVGLIVDGSFVMPAVDEPEDIDLVVLLPPDWDMAAGLRPFEYNLLSRRMARPAAVRV